METFTPHHMQHCLVEPVIELRRPLDLNVGQLRELATYGSVPERPDPLPPKRGPVTFDDLTPAEQSLLRPPAWMRPCRHDHGRA